MNILKPNLKSFNQLEKENEVLKNKISMLEQEIELRKDIANSDKVIYESKIKHLRNLLFVASALIMLLGLSFNLWR